MSSFVVRKEAFMRAAGLLAGIQDASRREIIYDYKRQKWLAPEDWQAVMSEFYDMNAASVIEQYHDEQMQGTPPTEKECTRTFKEYRKKGTMLFTSIAKRPEMIMHLRNFFSCVQYQTEKEAYYYAMMMFFGRVNTHLMQYLAPEPCDGWSALKIDEKMQFADY